jgi:hypothetical protein
MRVTTAHFSFTLPPNFTPQPPAASWSAIDGAKAQEITVSSLMAGEDAPLDPTLRQVAELRIDVLRKAGGAERVEPVTFETQGERRIAWFVAKGKNPLLSYCALVTHERPVMGQRCIVSFCVYQYVAPGITPDAAGFLALAAGIVRELEPLPERAVLERASAKAQGGTDATRVYPYLVPAGYVQGRPPVAIPPVTIGHGLYVALAEDFDGAARVFFPGEGPSRGTPDESVRAAKENLARAVHEQRVSVQGFQGPRGLPVMLFGRQWLAASCLLLPDLHSFASRHLGDGPLCASVPHRDTLLVFRQEDAAYRTQMRELIARNEAGAPKPLTPDLFAVRKNGIEAMSTAE